MAAYRGKRAIDLLVGLPALVLSLPVQAVVAAAVWRRLGSPIIFRQVRPGLGGEPFELRKFRTMLPIDAGPERSDDDSRMTSFGAWLRSTSLDELPTLWNVVRGDMSLVGPRPLLLQYLDRYSQHQARRHEVRPGMTGLAQVSGRNAITWDHKLDLDVEYVDRCSFLLDLRVVLRTVGQVVRRHGVTADGQATMPEFTGSASQDRAS